MIKGEYERKRKLLDTVLSPLTGYVEHRRYVGWKGFLPFYDIYCPYHGRVVDYRHGYEGRLSCPLCREKRLREMKEDE